jgi:antitoxin ParD1/3/4
VRELIRKEQERTRLRELLLEGADSESGRPADEEYFNGLRSHARERAKR